MPYQTKRQKQEAEAELRSQPTRRDPLMSDTDINNILMNGAQIAFTKMKRAKSFNNRLYLYAQICAFLEVSLSRGAGITDDTRDDLNHIHEEATHLYMQVSREQRDDEDEQGAAS